MKSLVFFFVLVMGCVMFYNPFGLRTDLGHAIVFTGIKTTAYGHYLLAIGEPKPAIPNALKPLEKNCFYSGLGGFGNTSAANFDGFSFPSTPGISDTANLPALEKFIASLKVQTSAEKMFDAANAKNLLPPTQ